VRRQLESRGGGEISSSKQPMTQVPSCNLATKRPAWRSAARIGPFAYGFMIGGSLRRGVGHLLFSFHTAHHCRQKKFRVLEPQFNRG
jgi:hypothetical protein